MLKKYAIMVIIMVRACTRPEMLITVDAYGKRPAFLLKRHVQYMYWYLFERFLLQL